MAALPYMQLYVSDYLADTIHLSAEEHGAYLLILFNYWQTGAPIPEDRLSAAAKIPNGAWPGIKAKLSPYFTQDENGDWVHERVERDLAKVRAKSTQASKAGKASAAKRGGGQVTVPKEDSNGRSTDAERTLNHTEADTDTDTDTEADNRHISPNGDMGKPKGSPGDSLISQAEEVLVFLNTKFGRNWSARTPNGKPTANGLLVISRLKDGYTQQELRTVAIRKWRDWHDDDHMAKYLRPETLFGKQKFATYLGECVADG